MAKDARVPIRLPSALKEELEWAADQDGARSLSAWLRSLAEERAEWLRERERLGGAGPLPRTEAAKVARRNGHVDREPELVAFVPGFGLEEE